MSGWCGRFLTMKSMKNLAEDLRLISDYRTRLAAIGSSVASESKILRGALKWEKELGKSCRVSRSRNGCEAATGQANAEAQEG